MHSGSRPSLGLPWTTQMMWYTQDTKEIHPPQHLYLKHQVPRRRSGPTWFLESRSVSRWPNMAIQTGSSQDRIQRAGSGHNWLQSTEGTRPSLLLLSLRSAWCTGGHMWPWAEGSRSISSTKVPELSPWFHWPGLDHMFIGTNHQGQRDWLGEPRVDSPSLDAHGLRAKSR